MNVPHRRRLTALVLVALAAGCLSATPEPGAAFIGFYEATESVDTVQPGFMGHRADMVPLSLLRGNFADVVVNDGVCLLPADAVGNTLSLHQSHCVRPVEQGAHVDLSILSGQATLSGRNLTLTATGTFDLIPPADAGAGGPQPASGTFALTITGTRQ